MEIEVNEIPLLHSQKKKLITNVQKWIQDKDINNIEFVDIKLHLLTPIKVYIYQRNGKTKFFKTEYIDDMPVIFSIRHW